MNIVDLIQNASDIGHHNRWHGVPGEHVSQHNMICNIPAQFSVIIVHGISSVGDNNLYSISIRHWNGIWKLLITSCNGEGAIHLT